MREWWIYSETKPEDEEVILVYQNEQCRIERKRNKKEGGGGGVGGRVKGSVKCWRKMLYPPQAQPSVYGCVRQWAPHLWGTTGKWESSPAQKPPGQPNRCSAQTIKLLHKHRSTNQRRLRDNDNRPTLLTHLFSDWVMYKTYLIKMSKIKHYLNRIFQVQHKLGSVDRI